jgi:hypothetical protein
MSKVLAKYKSIVSTIIAHHTVVASWPLQRWGIDIMGPLTTAQGNYKYAVVVVE